MPNLVYYKDKSGVVSGPLKEEEATALYKANFFGPDHVFRIVDANSSEEFISIVDLRSLNGAETPFGQNGEAKEEKELVRVYKELATVLKERNEMQLELNKMKAKYTSNEDAKKRLLEIFNNAVAKWDAFTVKCNVPTFVNRLTVPRTRFTNNSPTSVRCLIADSWDPVKTLIVGSSAAVTFESNKTYIYVAPYISDDPLDGSEHVCIFRNSSNVPFIKFE